ncbi:hypothetical protein PTT_17912, partial [Pyrenophora teres f. teres 0-1]
TIGLVNYKLRLLLGIRIYSIFYKKLLELALLDAKLATDVELKDNEYKVEEIKNL